MRKYILTLITVFTVSILLFCGCSGDRLSLEEYKTASEAAFKGWITAATDWADFAGKNIMNDDRNAEFGKVRENRDALEQKLLKVEAALDELDKLGNPPAEYDELHKKLKNGVSIEREWLKIQREMINSQTFEQYSGICEKAETFFDKYDSSLDNPETLPAVYVAMVRKWNSAQSGVSQ